MRKKPRAGLSESRIEPHEEVRYVEIVVHYERPRSAIYRVTSLLLKFFLLLVSHFNCGYLVVDSQCRLFEPWCLFDFIEFAFEKVSCHFGYIFCVIPFVAVDTGRF